MNRLASPSTIRVMEIRSKRLAALPPYLFVEIDRKRRARVAAGADVINLGIGDPDRPTPSFILDAMTQAMRDPTHHRYPPSEGTVEFRRAAARFMKKRFGVEADPDRHIVACIGSKEGIAHLPLAVTDPGDTILIPRPCYPVYVAGAVFAGARVEEVPASAQTGWLPPLDGITRETWSRSKLLWLNYPNNPTAACVDPSFYARALALARPAGTIVASDQAYSEIFFESRPASLWQAEGAALETTRAIEFHSLSKTFNMTGWRVAFAVGHPEVVGALAAVKANCDSGQFGAVQQAGAVALDHADHAEVEAMRREYRLRRDALIPGLRRIGCGVEPPAAGFFVWARCPLVGGREMDSMRFASRALEEADVVVVPGAGFAEEARGWFRIALTVEVDRLREAVDRLARVDWTR